ncbi:MAG: carbohydrate porin [Variovorax sp.]|jgi:hypothetical protein|nr:MAG: carbohydrate porin [Variovorax sp.]
MRIALHPLLTAVTALLPMLVHAADVQADADTTPETWNAHVQATYVWQRKPSFAAAYSGPNSLSAARELSYSFTATAFFGARLWRGGELYFDPEGAQGVPLSNLTGFGGFTNGEMARSSGPNLRIYRARFFLRQTWDGGGEQVPVASGQNQLGGSRDSRRWVFTAGNLSVLDLFDANAYSHDPRTQFLNWSVMTHGAYDYAADARGYSWGAVLEWYRDEWAVRGGRFIQPIEPNGQKLDENPLRHYGDQVEIERSHMLAGQPGKLRLLAFSNRARMTRYDDALALAQQTGTVPDINAARYGNQMKRGFGVNLEQAVSDDIGLFARASWADGKTETYAFTDIDRSVSGGLLVKGSAWQRAQDTVGLAFARNAISRAQRDYLSAGGIAFFIGDGQLRYRQEGIAEVFYNLNLTKGTWITLDWQYIRNPAYNAARGPVNVGSVRLHAEF